MSIAPVLFVAAPRATKSVMPVDRTLPSPISRRWPGTFAATAALLVGLLAVLTLVTQPALSHWFAVALLFVLVGAIFVRERAALRSEHALRLAAERVSKQLAASESRLAAALESTTDHVLILDRDWNIAFVNRRAIVDEMGPERGLAAGKNLWKLYPEIVGSTFDRNYRLAMKTQEPVIFEEFLPMTARWFEVHAYPAHDLLSVFFADITERKRAEADLLRLAALDPLTGLHNRRSFRNRLDELLVVAFPEQPVTVLYLDVDDFKDINDSYGHARGDRILILVAERLRKAAGADMVARLGGDEFAVISRAAASPEQAASLALRLLADFEPPLSVDGDVIRVGVSVGIVMAPLHGRDADRLLQFADIALYAAKGTGRRTARMFEDRMAAARQVRQLLKDDLGSALVRGEFALLYQPIVDVDRNRIIGAEALVRWHHPRRGEVGPTDFIPLAEETGLIVDLGAWVLRRACEEAARWPGDVKVAVNLSSAQFRSPRLPRDVADALAESGLPPGRLEIEITESALLQDTEANLRTLTVVRELGLRIALDDFGTGYSSLAYLNRFPIDKIKIDRSFVSQVPERAEARAIVQAVTGLAAALNLRVTGEGVESEAQLRFLRDHGCHEAQGYLVGAPMPRERFERLLFDADNPAAPEPPPSEGRGASAAAAV